MEIKNKIKNFAVEHKQELTRAGYFAAGYAVGITAWTLTCRVHGYRMTRPHSYNPDTYEFFVTTPNGKLLASSPLPKTD